MKEVQDALQQCGSARALGHIVQQDFTHRRFHSISWFPYGRHCLLLCVCLLSFMRHGIFYSKIFGVGSLKMGLAKQGCFCGKPPCRHVRDSMTLLPMPKGFQTSVRLFAVGLQSFEIGPNLLCGLRILHLRDPMKHGGTQVVRIASMLCVLRGRTWSKRIGAAKC